MLYKMESKPMIVYFDIGGRGESCRLAAVYGGYEFEDNRVDELFLLHSKLINTKLLN
jgi:hypothetical protein